MSSYLILAGAIGTFFAIVLVKRWQALQAFKVVGPYVAVLTIAFATVIVSAFPWAIMVDDLAALRLLRSTTPTLAEEAAKVALALSLFATGKSSGPLPKAALATGLMLGIIESTLIASRCYVGSAPLATQLCAVTLLLRPLGQCLLTYCTMVAASQRLWPLLGLVVLTHLMVNLAGLITLSSPGQPINSTAMAFVLGAGRQVLMVLLAGLIALWLRRILLRKAAS